MKLLDLFSGIGGFSLAARWMNWETVQFVELDKFCQQVLRKHWPNVPIHGDIKTFDGTKLRGTVDIVTGGFPCQPFSTAGKRKGTEDDRHLWPEMLRVIGEVQPRWIVGENVAGFVNWEGGMVLSEVKASLEDKGYRLLPPALLPANGKATFSIRTRAWLIAYAVGRQPKQKIEIVNEIENREEATGSPFGTWLEAASRLCGVATRLPNRVDRIKSLGNSICPQVAFEIFKAIEQVR